MANKLTVEQAEHALKATSGNVSAAARQLGVSRITLYKRINESPALKQSVEDFREELVDIAETMLKKQIIAGNIAAIIFALKTQGKDRGYVERVNHDLTTGGEKLTGLIINLGHNTD